MKYTVIVALLLIAIFGLFVLHKKGEAASNSYLLSSHELADFASLEPIDAHTHIATLEPQLLVVFRTFHLRAVDILYVDNTDSFRNAVEPQKKDTLASITSSENHLLLCTTFDPYQIAAPHFSGTVIAQLNDDFAKGAVAVKIWKNIGMQIVDKNDKYVMPDDDRLFPIYRDIARHNQTLITHSADPDHDWGAPQPLGVSNEYLIQHPQWNMSGKPGAPSKEEIIGAVDHVLSRNRDLRVIGAHFGSMETHLEKLAVRLDQNPNFAVDTAGRIHFLYGLPSADVRTFFLKYQDRILYGTDFRFEPRTNASAVQLYENQLTHEWLYLATDRTLEYQGRRIQGINLPREVLKKVYHDNAVKWFPGINQH